MSGSRAFYVLTTAIKDSLLANEFTNQVTYGDLSEIDLSKKSMFPICHLQITNAEIQSNVIIFSVQILFADIVFTDLEINENITDNNYVSDTMFDGSDNDHDVLNAQLYVANKLIQSLTRGDLRGDGYELTGTVNCEPFSERFQNRLSGWDLNFRLMVKNDVSAC